MRLSQKFVFILIWVILSQNEIIAQNSYFQGYVSDVSGTRFTYHSPLPEVTSCLLARANKNFEPVVWKTEIVPSDYKNKMVTFIWLYGMDVLTESQDFDMYVNDQKWFSFSSPLDNDKTIWSVNGKDGALLTFHRTMIDRHKDQMGFVTMTIPTAAIKHGEANIIKVDPRDNESNAWYMTYKTELREEVLISQNKVVVKHSDQQFHLARFDFTHLSDPANASINVNGIKKSITLLPGHNEMDVDLPKVDQPTNFTAEIKIGNAPVKNYKFTLAPVREWTIYLVQHTHTDIGYTRSQTEIMAEHLRYIDNALDYCDQTDHYAEDAKFRWTCEASWAVREYLNSRPEAQVERLLQRIKEGRIEVTSMFFNFCDIVDESALAFQTKTLSEFKRRGIDVKTAMQNDVNGIGWCMIDFYSDTDVKYLTMGQHGHRAHVPFHQPTPFWWVSQAGNRLLAYRSEHYMHGNALALTSGFLDGFRSNLSGYLDKLEQKGYPYDRTSIQFSGYVTDNSPPSTGACDIVKEWNDLYEWPKLRMALANEFMIYLDQHERDSLPAHRVAWPDWWTDGFGSAMNETKAARNAHGDMIANTGLLSMAKLMGAQLPGDIHRKISDVYDRLLFFDEHTFGAAESITDPMSENSVIQWGEKSASAWESMKQAGMIRELALGFLQPYIQKSDVPSIVVFNTLNWTRSGLIKVFIDHDILPTNKEFSILDEKGVKMHAQALNSRSEGTYWNIWVKDIPSIGYKTFRIVVSNQNKLSEQPDTTTDLLENQYYRLKIDRKNGVVTSMFDKELNLELLDLQDSVKLGQIIYEQIASREAMERLTNANRDTVYVPLKGSRSALSGVTVSKVTEGEIWSRVRIHGTLPICADSRGVNLEIRLFNTEKRIDFLYDMYKLQVDDPEAVYVAFPFKLNQGRLAFDVQGGTVMPGVNQLEGTASDWNTMQSFTTVMNEDAQIILTSSDIPLIQLGAINTGRFYYKHIPQTTSIYSWVLNNYWTTNFKKSQSGEMKWTYSITSAPDPGNTFASKVGFNYRIPLIGRVLAKGKETQPMQSRSLLDPGVSNLVLINANLSADGKGVILHLRETEGQNATLDIAKLKQDTGAKFISEVNILEEELQVLDKPMLIEKYGTKFIKINLY